MPVHWLNKTLMKSFDSWLSVYGPTAAELVSTDKHLGGILKCLSKFGIRAQKEHDKLLATICSNILTTTCSSNQRGGRLCYNLLNMSEAFVNWNFDPEKYSKNFWTKWYEVLSKVSKSAIQPQVQAQLQRDCFLVMLKFDCEKEFNKIRNDWIEFVKQNSLEFSPMSSFVMLVEAEKKFGKQSQLYEFYLPQDVDNLLQKRTTPLIVVAYLTLFLYAVAFLTTILGCYSQYYLSELVNNKK